MREVLRAILGDCASASVAALGAELARAGVVMTPAQLAAAMRGLLDG